MRLLLLSIACSSSFFLQIKVVSTAVVDSTATLQAYLGTAYAFPNEPFGWYTGVAANTYSVLVQASNTNAFRIVGTAGTAGENFVIDNISVRKITKNLSLFVPNNLGIGTANPQSPVHILSVGSGVALTIEGTDQTSPKLRFASGGLNGGGYSDSNFDSGNTWFNLTDASFRYSSGFGIQWAGGSGPLIRCDTANYTVGLYIASSSRLQIGGYGTLDFYRAGGANFGAAFWRSLSCWFRKNPNFWNAGNDSTRA